MWPFSKPEPPDNRPPSPSAKAVAASLAEEPARWKIGGKTHLLIHDSWIAIDVVNNWLLQPNVYGVPDADEAVIADGVQQWIAARLALPKEDPQPVATEANP